MATDDRRMHEGRSRSLDDREPRNHAHDEPYTDADRIGAKDEPPQSGPVEDVEDVDSTVEREQESALGGHVATRSGGA